MQTTNTLPSGLCDPRGEGNSKITLAHLSTLLRRQGVDFSALWKKIELVVLQTLACVEHKMVNHVGAFEVYGYAFLTFKPE